jgi:hypothetical protein
VCRSTERALMVHVERHPDSRSFAVWSTAFEEAGQGSLFGDVHSFADDADGRAELCEHLVADFVGWIHDGFSIKVGSDDYT